MGGGEAEKSHLCFPPLSAISLFTTLPPRHASTGPYSAPRKRPKCFQRSRQKGNSVDSRNNEEQSDAGEGIRASR